MEAIKNGEADYAVLPLDNSTAGIVNDTYDLLREYDNFIVAEETVKIEHALVGIPGTDISKVKRVYSHAQGLMQCAKFLEDKGWQQLGAPNTADAAKKILEDKENYTSKENNDLAVPITKNDNKERRFNSQVVYPIISDGDVIGSVILLSKEAGTKMTEVEQKVVQSAASFLGKQMEI